MSIDVYALAAQVNRLDDYGALNVPRLPTPHAL